MVRYSQVGRLTETELTNDWEGLKKVIRTLIKDKVAQFKGNSLASRYLESIQNSKTLAAFEAGGADSWKFYLENLPDESTKRDQFKITFFEKLLKPDLYQRITESNDYEAAFVVQNVYLSWGRTTICDFTTERYGENS